MEVQHTTLAESSEKLLAAIVLASHTPQIIDRLKRMLYTGKQAPHQIANKNASNLVGEPYSYKLSQSYTPMRVNR